MKPEHVCKFCDPDTRPGCFMCNGTGFANFAGDLGPTHSQPKRPVYYSPSDRVLCLGVGKRAVAYELVEDRADTPGDRLFRFRRIDGAGFYWCLAASDGSFVCDCAGATYCNTDKANCRARLAGKTTVESEGCKHADALRALLSGGWLDLPDRVATEPQPQGA